MLVFIANAGTLKHHKYTENMMEKEIATEHIYKNNCTFFSLLTLILLTGTN